ncbi:MAG: epoxyqueuosine reductase QueH [Anaerovoracaceae bacterium]
MENLNQLNILNKHRVINVDNKLEISKPSILLHSCCGPCSTAVMERLVSRFQVTIYFYNPNITDEEEYIRRRDSQILAVKEFNKESSQGKVGYKEGPYDPENFYLMAKGLEEEKEGGNRCTKCFNLRLIKTAEIANIEKYDFFGTTLTVSPHKNYLQIGQIGNVIGAKYGVTFLNEDFKKKAGFQRSIELSKKFKLYRQNYCGCQYSVWDK